MLTMRKVCLVLFVLLRMFSCSYFQYENVNEEETECKCVPSHLCSDNEAVNGDELLDIRFEDDPCPNHYEVCCENIKTSSELDNNNKVTNKGCGFHNLPNVYPRITVNSDLTEFAEFPWTILVLQKEKKTERNAFICGGSLIHPQVVITAAHCVFGSENVQVVVRAGEWNIRTKDEPLPHIENIVKEIIIHPHYRPGVLWNDIALLFLQNAFNEAEHISFICLPNINNFELTGDNLKCLACGWGKNAFQKGRHSSVLKKVTLPLVHRNQCQTSLRTTRLGKFFRLHKSFICAGGERNRDACKGDGGSPLICPIPGHVGRYVQIGIVSWGIGCGNNKTPGVYVNVPLFITWIDDQMVKRNLNTTYYKY